MAATIEYKVVILQAANEAELENHLNNEGSRGWILSALVPLTGQYLAAFYRPKAR